ncbi:hypothetical protein D1007_52397 [Hordeum vulgare]|nr:hypothetical protein D1007_52397 [Hordeum vulgare]
MAKKRQELALFPPGIETHALWNRYRFMWAVKTTMHPPTIVKARESGPEPDKYPFFANFFYCGLCPPFSEFFVDIRQTYGFRLLDFTPNVVTCMSIFAHLNENFIGIVPNTALFHHYFIPRIQRGDVLPDSITWIPRTGFKEAYV